MASHQANAVKALQERAMARLSKYTSINSNASSLMIDQSKIASAVEGLGNMRLNPNSLETPSSYTMKLSKAAGKLLTESSKIKENVLKTYTNYTLDIDTRIAQRAGIKQNEYAAEIRNVFRGLDAKKRTDFLGEIVENLDGAAFAAIFNAPEVLTGITKDMRINFTNSFHAKAAPDLFEEQEDIKEAIDNVLASIRIAEETSREYQDPQSVRRIELEVQKSQEAADKFNSAFEG